MTTHDFRPGDVVKWGPLLDGSSGQAMVKELTGPEHVTLSGHGDRTFHNCYLKRAFPQRTTDPTEHPSRSRAASSLRAASASLTTAIDHLTRAGEAETYPGQANTRTRTAAEETQACIHHATMALYWLLHERLS